MNNIFNNIDDAYVYNLESLQTNGSKLDNNIEILNHSVVITDITKRYITSNNIQFDLIYAIGQILWYLKGNDKLDAINYYDINNVWTNRSDDGVHLNAAYGSRIFGKKIFFNQWLHIIQQLKNNPNTRQAVITIYTANDFNSKDLPCTFNLQYFIRDNKLHQIINMRSNDAVWGFTYDSFAFMFLQELLALELNIESGTYYHNANSFHIYEKNYTQLTSNYNKEYYDTIKISKYFLQNLNKILELECNIRENNILSFEYLNDNFSRNILYILVVQKLIKNNCINDANEYILNNSNDMYDIFYKFLNRRLNVNNR